MKVLSKEPKSNSGGLKAARTSWAPRQSYNLTMGFYQWTTGPRQKKAGVKGGIFPDCYKIAQVIPLFKGGDKEDSNCYRPISLLPTISKIFEKLLASRLINFFTKYKVLSKDQFGFRAKFSMEYAIVDIYDKLVKNLDEGLSSCSVFFRFSKSL